MELLIPANASLNYTTDLSAPIPLWGLLQLILIAIAILVILWLIKCFEQPDQKNGQEKAP